MVVVKLAIPNKGRLSEGALGILRKIGLQATGPSDRRLMADLSRGRYQVLFVNAKDIPQYVAQGVADAGITGLDLVEEQGKEVAKVLDLGFGHCRLVVAGPEDGILSIADIPEGCTVATAFPRLTQAYFADRGKKVNIVPVSGAAEVTPHVGLADFIVDLVETGSTLKVNRLRALETILRSEAVLIANPGSLKLKDQEMRELVRALESVANAARKRYLMANVPSARLDEVSSLVPGISGPTVMNIAGREDMVAIHAVVSEDELNGVIVVLKDLGATGILVVPIERMVT